MAAYHTEDVLVTRNWLAVHRDELWAQRLVLSTGELYLFTLWQRDGYNLKVHFICNCSNIDQQLHKTANLPGPLDVLS